MNYASIVPLNDVKETIGLLQISDIAGGRSLSVLIAVFALFAVSINLISWTSGISQLIKQSSKKGLLPGILSKDESKSENRCILFLGAIFIVNLTIATSFRDTFFKLLSLVSSNFLLIYILGLVSYSIFINNKFKKIFAVAIALVLSITMTSSGYLLVYPVIVIAISSFLTLKRNSDRILQNG
jgi:amino acid transporter